MRDYNKLKWYSSEREEYYSNVNSSYEKMIGDEGEEIVKEYFMSLGCQVIYSPPIGDASKHVDFYVKMEGKGFSVDVKHQKVMTLEIKNHWGNTGSTLLPDGKGADVVVHLIQGTKTAYMYKRSMMRDWWNNHKGLHKFTSEYKGATLFKMYPKTLNELSFVSKIEL